MCGYRDSLYAKSLEEFGSPIPMPKSGTWLLQRTIPGTTASDLMACYPLLACRDWNCLRDDIGALNDNLVSIAAVSDPFGDYDESLLRRLFPDRMFAFKTHYVTDLSQDPSKVIASHHLRNVRKSLQRVCVYRCIVPSDHLEEWILLYECLKQRHNISGIQAFSRASFNAQFRVPGLTVFRAVHQSETIGMLLWYSHANVSYYHLGAYSERGYELGAAYALFHAAIAYFESIGQRWLSLGSGAGLDGDGTDGLSRFKKGWSTGTRTAYFCGRILNPDAYEVLARERQVLTSSYFPAYRASEFG